MKGSKPQKPPGSPGEWLSHAESDLRLARLAYSDETIHFEQICFHTQQAAEKAIKAVLFAQHIDFPLTHDIEELLEIADTNGVVLSNSVQEAGQLTPYAVETRYPGAWFEIEQIDVIEAL